MLQNEVNEVWGKEWEDKGCEIQNLFKQRFFVEGYPILKKYIPKKTTNILDIGAATGRYSVKFAADFPNATVYATDIVDSSLQMIHRVAKFYSVPNIIIQKEDGGNLSFSNNSFDVVYAGMLLQILPDPEKVLKEMKRVLKPGGVIIITTVNFWNFHSLFKWYLKVFNRPKEYYGEEKARSPKELSKLLSDAGFLVQTLDGFYPAYGVYRLKAYWKPAALIGKIINRTNRIIDPLTNRFFSRFFGFEIVCVARKEK